MDVLTTLLADAHTAGLTVQAADGKLLVRGPKSAEPVVRRLMERKTDVLSRLSRADKPCRCGSTQYVDVPISEGRIRRDCRNCGRFRSWAKWYEQGTKA